MLSEICDYLHNYFDTYMPKHFGYVGVVDGEPAIADTDLELLEGQYYRVVGSAFNDGVHRYGDKSMVEEPPFEGAIWAMAVPPELLVIEAEIEEWAKKYQHVDSDSMSPYTSESFAGYSYSKGDTAANGGTSWKDAYASRLSRWRKLKV